MPKLVDSIIKKRVKKFLILFLCLVTSLCVLVNCRSIEIEGHDEGVPGGYHQPRYLTSYWVKAQNVHLDGIGGIDWHQPYIFFPPLRIDEKGQVCENYSVSISKDKNENEGDHLGTIYDYSSEFTLKAKGFSGFIEALASYFDKSATQFYIYELPENLEEAMMVKYYYRVDNIPALNASNKTYQIVLMIAIEWMQIDGQNIQLKTIWKGEMVLNLSQSIDWIEALNLGYHKLSQHVLQEGTKKDHINLLNF